MFSSRYYTSIHNLPMSRWLELHKTGNLTELVIYKGLFKIDFKKLKKIYNDIQTEFINTFGLNENLKKIHELRRDIQILKIEIHVEGDRSRIPFMKMKEEEIDSIIASFNNSKKNKSFTVHLEKYMGFQIDENKVTVYQYHRYIDIFNEEIEQRLKESMQHGRRN